MRAATAPESHRMSEASAAALQGVPYRTFMCVVCGFMYNEAEGWPADGIEPGTRWEDVPETWTCPDCGVTKSDFEMIEV
jgi:rubredoxin